MVISNDVCLRPGVFLNRGPHMSALTAQVCGAVDCGLPATCGRLGGTAELGGKQRNNRRLAAKIRWTPGKIQVEHHLSGVGGIKGEGPA